MRRRIAQLLLRLAFRAWPDFEPRVVPLSFAFQDGRGLVVYRDGWRYSDLGCRLVYLPDHYTDSAASDEYARAHLTLRADAERFEIGAM
jgi:hypothetical protein